MTINKYVCSHIIGMEGKIEKVKFVTESVNADKVATVKIEFEKGTLIWDLNRFKFLYKKNLN